MAFGVLFVAIGCESTQQGTGPADGTFVGGSGRRALSTSVVADGSSTTVNATVLDDRGLATMLRDGEKFVAEYHGTEQVLVQTQDENGDPIYRASLPFLLTYADIQLRFMPSGTSGGSIFATMRVDTPFTIKSSPSQVRIGDELRVELDSGSSYPSGNPLITFEGSCVAPTEPTFLQTYGSVSEARFDTTNLAVTGSGCSVTTTVMFVHESRTSAGGNDWDSTHAPEARGIQQRRFTTYLVR